jgi:hypothetical protein
MVKYLPELQNRVLSGFENIFSYNSENVLVGSDIGFYNINYTKYREKTYPYFTYLTLVKLTGNQDSVIYGGYDPNIFGRTAKISLPFKYNSIHFSFASSLIMDKPATEFSYYLEGYSNNWSEWDLRDLALPMNLKNLPIRLKLKRHGIEPFGLTFFTY